jgi:hypothetical protein
VQFVPTAPAEGFPMQPATGDIGPDGRFRMGTFAPHDGVVPGQYQVAVVSVLGGPTPDEPFAEKIWNVPKQYANPSTSGLSAEVPPGSKPVRLDLELSQ